MLAPANLWPRTPSVSVRRTMSRAGRLDNITGIARHRENNAARVMVEHRQRVASHQARQSQLEGFLQEYQRRLQEDAQRGVQVAQLQNYQLFIQKLTQAVQRQAKEVQRCCAELETRRQQWLECRQAADSLSKVAERRRIQEQQEGHRREQREADDRPRMLDGDSGWR